jgi:plasmid stability protein
MRTTLNIDDDVIDKARTLAARLHRSFRHVVNEALRAGLESIESPGESRPYHTSPHNMGLKPGRDLDNIQELLAQVEGEDFR